METRLEHILTSSYKYEMIASMKSHPEDFDEAIQLALADRQPYSKRAAWLLWSVMDENDHRIQNHMENILDALTVRGDEQARELMIILQRMDLNVTYEGRLFDICVSIWKKTEKQPSVRFNAFKLMIKISKKHPDLSKELFFLMEPQYMDSLSDTVKRSVSKLVAKLDE